MISSQEGTFALRLRDFGAFFGSPSLSTRASCCGSVGSGSGCAGSGSAEAGSGEASGSGSRSSSGSVHKR